jgi:sulfite reductase beta subunit-like hemoprotein
MSNEERFRHLLDVEELPGEGWAPLRSAWTDEEEIDTFDEFVRDFWNGKLSPDDFRKFRLQNGIYGQKQEGVQMVRVKIPWGGLVAEQIDILADIAAATPRELAHVTTRQNVQYHFVTLDRVTEHLRRLAEVGLTTREACGNTVRNVTAGYCAGVCEKEAFDVTPYAEAVARYLLRNPMNQNLPRKFKISFSGCPDDTGITAIHDIGCKAVIKEVNGRPVRGFQVYIGGGLGSFPKVSQLLEEFTPAENLLLTVAAIVRIFDRQGNRENRNQARLKFVLDKLGVEEVRKLVLQERVVLETTMAGLFPEVEIWEERAPVRPTNGQPADLSGTEDIDAYQRWLRTNVTLQKQPEHAMVHVRLILGDITPVQLRTLAQASRQFGNGAVRATAQQNFVLRWIRQADLPKLHQFLARAGLALPGAERAVDVTSCPGADTCQLGITSSRGLALAIGEIFGNGLAELAEEAGVRIKISGCPNSCGQHHIANIGFYGGAKKYNGEQAPAYQMLLGASLDPGDVHYGKPTAKIPSKNIPAVVERLLLFFRDERLGRESFNAFLGRIGNDKIKEIIAPLTTLAPSSEAPDKYKDWGAETTFTVDTGPGECAA